MRNQRNFLLAEGVCVVPEKSKNYLEFFLDQDIKLLVYNEYNSYSKYPLLDVNFKWKGKEMSSYIIHVFISHSWKYSEQYNKLAEWISYPFASGQASVTFKDYSVPSSEPIDDARTVSALKDAIYGQIARSHVIIIPSGMYATYSNWINKEIEGAQSYKKPILGVEPWGQQKNSAVVQKAANLMVGWNASSVRQGIWDLYYRNN